jgi:DNA-3-methyladenine glycosylase II
MEKINTVHLDHTGSYSLSASIDIAAKASFVNDFNPGSDVLDLAILMEGTWKSVGIQLSQKNKKVVCHVFDNPSNAKDSDIKEQLERMLCLDTDGNGFEKVIAHDKVIAKLSKLSPGLRPVLFASCYEAAASAIIGHQLPVKQAARIKHKICEAHGVKLTIADRILYAFPSPSVLEKLPYIDGLAERKVDQLRVLGSKTGSWLTSAALLRLNKEDAFMQLEKLPGIGAFSSELIMLRGAGDTDYFPKTETRLHRAMALAYDLGADPYVEKLMSIAEKWKPYRAWAGLLLRNSIPR